MLVGEDLGGESLVGESLLVFFFGGGGGGGGSGGGNGGRGGGGERRRRSKVRDRTSKVGVSTFINFSSSISLTLLSLAMSDETSSEPAPGSCDPPPPLCCWEAEGSSEPRTSASMSAISKLAQRNGAVDGSLCRVF